MHSAKVGDNPQGDKPPGDNPLAKTFFGEYILLIFLYFLLLLFVWIFDVILHRLYD